MQAIRPSGGSVYCWTTIPPIARGRLAAFWTAVPGGSSWCSPPSTLPGSTMSRRFSPRWPARCCATSASPVDRSYASGSPLSSTAATTPGLFQNGPISWPPLTHVWPDELRQEFQNDVLVNQHSTIVPQYQESEIAKDRVKPGP